MTASVFVPPKPGSVKLPAPIREAPEPGVLIPRDWMKWVRAGLRKKARQNGSAGGVRVFVSRCTVLHTSTGTQLVLYPSRAAALGCQILQVAGATVTSDMQARYLKTNCVESLHRAGTCVQLETRGNEAGVRIDFDDEIVWLSMTSATSVGQQLIDSAE